MISTDVCSCADGDAPVAMLHGYEFLTILQSATLEIGPLIRPRTCQKSALEDPDQKFDSDDVPFYDSNPSTRLARQGIIFIIFFFG